MIIIAIQATLLIALILLAIDMQYKAGRIKITNELLIKQRKYHWNPLTFRYELETHQLEALSFKEVTPQEIYHVMGSIEYNPTHHYRDKIKLMPREMGHDLEYRYIAKLNNK